MRRVLPWGRLGLALALGCSFDASGITETSTAGLDVPSSGGSTVDPSGDPSGDPGTSGAGPGSASVTTGGEGTGDGSSSGAVEPVTTGGPDTGEPMTTDPSTSTGQPDPSTTGADETTGEPPDDTTTTGAPMCPMSYKQIVTVEQAMVVPPMGKYDSVIEDSVVAYSGVTGAGIIHFPVTPPCDGPVAVWARVLDANPGSYQQNDPDSYYPFVDGGAETGWFYGCQSGGLDDDKYYWLRVRGGMAGQPCNTQSDWTPQLTAGPHTVSLRNREGQNPQYDVAAVSRLLVTSDLNYMPGGND